MGRENGTGIVMKDGGEKEVGRERRDGEEMNMYHWCRVVGLASEMKNG